MGCCQRYGYMVPLFFGCLFFFGSIGFDFLISMGINQELGKVCYDKTSRVLSISSSFFLTSYSASCSQVTPNFTKTGHRQVWQCTLRIISFMYEIRKIFWKAKRQQIWNKWALSLLARNYSERSMDSLKMILKSHFGLRHTSSTCLRCQTILLSIKTSQYSTCRWL